MLAGKTDVKIHYSLTVINEGLPWSKCCDLVNWNNKTEQWHFVDILYIGLINGMVKVLFKVHFKCLVHGSAFLARSAMNGSITSGSNDRKPPPHTSNRTCFTAWSHVGHATIASQHTAHWCRRALLAGTDRQPWDFCFDRIPSRRKNIL